MSGGNVLDPVWSYDEKRGHKLHEKNIDGRGQRRPQSRTTKKPLGYMIKQNMKSGQKEMEKNPCG